MPPGTVIPLRVRVLIDYLAKAFARDFRSRLGIDQ